jgi:hypothetical protein
VAKNKNKMKTSRSLHRSHFAFRSTETPSFSTEEEKTALLIENGLIKTKFHSKKIITFGHSICI